MSADPDEPMGSRVRRLRLSRNWSQYELAMRANLSAQTISYLENDRRWPHLDTVMKIADALEVPLTEIAPFVELLGEEEAWKGSLVKLEQERLGAHWVANHDRFSIDPRGAADDLAAIQDNVVRQLHDSISQKALGFASTAKRLDNAVGWHGIASASERFAASVSRPIDEIPDHLGSAYSAILELGSFLELDGRLRASKDHSADPLEPEVHRSLSDLIRTAAPWLRRFPTIRDLDDDTAAFLSQSDVLRPSATLVAIATDQKLISAEDAAALTGLVEAARRGEFQGQKARTRGIFSVRNLLYASATLVAGFC
jgi:transcriptional regulator with XRE-family HTH domain